MSSTETVSQPAKPDAPWAKSLDRLRARFAMGGKGRETAIIPAASIAGRALVIVVAIMTLLASITAGSVTMLSGAASQWSSEIALEATLQVKPIQGRDIEADLLEVAALARRTAGIADARINSRDDAEKLLAPWFGSGQSLAELPVPRLIVLQIANGEKPDLAKLKADLGNRFPNVIVNDHGPWVDRLAALARGLVIAGMAILILVLVATAFAVVFATRAAMAESKEIISVLDLVGAEDRFIARAFQQHFLRLGLQGGLIGGAIAVLLFLLGSWLGFGGSDNDPLLGSLSLGFGGYLAIAIIVALVAAMTAYVSRRTVFNQIHS
jgi:cell division transport system permease protein